MNKDIIKIDLNQEVTQSLPFEPFAEFDDLCLGFLKEVSVTSTTAKTKEEGSKWEYAGMEVWQLIFMFQQYRKLADEKERLFFHRELSIATIKVTGVQITPKNLNNMYVELWKRIRHIHDQYKESPNYKPFTKAPEFNPQASKTDRAEAFKVFFNDMADAFNKGKGNKPIYEPWDNTDKTNLKILKLIASGDNKDKLDFPHYVGSGFMEAYSIDANGKLNTTLKLGHKETVKLGGDKGAPIPMGGGAGVASAVSDEVANKLLGRT